MIIVNPGKTYTPDEKSFRGISAISQETSAAAQPLGDAFLGLSEVLTLGSIVGFPPEMGPPPRAKQIHSAPTFSRRGWQKPSRDR
jgi:hypothetical protein